MDISGIFCIMSKVEQSLNCFNWEELNKVAYPGVLEKVGVVYEDFVSLMKEDKVALLSGSLTKSRLARYLLEDPDLQ